MELVGPDNRPLHTEPVTKKVDMADLKELHAQLVKVFHSQEKVPLTPKFYVVTAGATQDGIADSIVTGLMVMPGTGPDEGEEKPMEKDLFRSALFNAMQAICGVLVQANDNELSHILVAEVFRAVMVGMGFSPQMIQKMQAGIGFAFTLATNEETAGAKEH